MSASPTPSAKRPTSRPTLYQPQHLLAALRACADELGKPVGVTEYRRWSDYRSDVPSATTLISQFGSWSAAVSAVGHPGVGRRPLYSRDCTLAALRACADDLGEPVGVGDYRLWAVQRSGVPSLTTVIRQFGTWSAAMSAARLPRVVQPGPLPLYNGEDTLDAIRSAAAELGSPLRRSHYQRWAREHKAPSLRTIERQFGTWRAAATAAGVETAGQR